MKHWLLILMSVITSSTVFALDKSDVDCLIEYNVIRNTVKFVPFLVKESSFASEIHKYWNDAEPVYKKACDVRSVGQIYLNPPMHTAICEIATVLIKNRETPMNGIVELRINVAKHLESLYIINRLIDKMIQNNAPQPHYEEKPQAAPKQAEHYPIYEEQA
jgi:hypothetical protein